MQSEFTLFSGGNISALIANFLFSNLAFLLTMKMVEVRTLALASAKCHFGVAVKR